MSKGKIFFYACSICTGIYIVLKINLKFGMLDGRESLVLLSTLNAINIDKVGTIFNSGQEPKAFWVKRTLLMRYALFIFLKSFGLQISVSLSLATVLAIFKIVPASLLILLIAYMLVMNFGFVLTNMASNLFNILSIIFPILLITGEVLVRGSGTITLIVILVVLYSLIIHAVVTLRTLKFQGFQRTSMQEQLNSGDQWKILIKRLAEYKVFVVLACILDLVLVFFINGSELVRYVTPGSVMTIMFITFLETMIGNKTNEVELDKSRIKTILADSDNPFFARFKCSTIYMCCVILCMNVALSAIFQALFKMNVVYLSAVIYIPCTFLVGILYFRKSELLISTNNIKTKFVILVSYILVITGGIVVGVYL